jgi:hypothetical protein
MISEDVPVNKTFSRIDRTRVVQIGARHDEGVALLCRREIILKDGVTLMKTEREYCFVKGLSEVATTQVTVNGKTFTGAQILGALEALLDQIALVERDKPQPTI